MAADANDTQSGRISQLATTVSCIIFFGGLVLTTKAPFLSMANLVGLFFVGASVGIFFGYSQGKWVGSARWGILVGVGLLVVLFLLLWSGIIPETEPPTIPPPAHG